MIVKQLNRAENSSATENPINITTKYALIGAGVIGIAAIAYALSRKPVSTLPSGVVPVTTDPTSGLPIITLAPGNMGTLTTISTATGSGGQQINLNAPKGGAILSVVSSDSNVVVGMAGSTTTAGLALGTPDLPGTTTLTVSWTLGGAAQTTTITVVAS